MQITNDSQYLNATNVAKYLGISKPFLYKIMKNDPSFPKGLPLSRDKKVYDKSEIDNWVKNKN